MGFCKLLHDSKNWCLLLTLSVFSYHQHHRSVSFRRLNPGSPRSLPFAWRPQIIVKKVIFRPRPLPCTTPDLHRTSPFFPLCISPSLPPPGLRLCLLSLRLLVDAAAADAVPRRGRVFDRERLCSRSGLGFGLESTTTMGA